MSADIFRTVIPKSVRPPAPRPSPTVEPVDAGSYADADDAVADAIRMNDDCRPDLAVPLLRRALEIDPTHVDAVVELGATLTDVGQPDQALSAYDGFLVTQPGVARVRAARGHFLLRQSKLQDAIDEYRRCLCDAPDLTELYPRLVVALCRLGDVDGARLDLARFVRSGADERTRQMLEALIERTRTTT